MALRINDALRVRCEPGWTLAESWSQTLVDQDLWFVFDGRGTMRLRDGRRINLFAGVCIWARPGGLYLAEQDQRDRLGVLAIHFDGVAAPTREAYEFTDAGYAERVLNRVFESTMDGQRVVASRLFDALLTDIRSGDCLRSDDSTGTARHHRSTIQAVVARIREAPGDTPGIAQLAGRAGYSPDHFTRVFREIMGQSPRDFIIDARIARARQLLTESPLTVGQVAHVLGYDTLFYFSRQFKQRVGVSPSAYRAD